MSTPEQTTESTPPSLSLNDLLLMFQTLQVVTARGAIKANELSTVGGLHDRLYAFLEHSGVLKKSTQDDGSKQETPSND